jgi:hypothetical protein
MSIRPTDEQGASDVRKTVLILAVSLISLSSVPAASAMTAQEALGFANQQRAANGIPPLEQDQSLLRSECSLENHYIASPRVGEWSAYSSPWNEAPLHQSMLYSPTATSAAYGEYAEFKSNNPAFPGSAGPWACMWFSFNPEALEGSQRFYAFISEHGASDVPISEVASEYPATPGALVGLPEGETGHNLLVYALGYGNHAHIVSATLTSASGQSVEVRAADGTMLYEGQGLMFPGTGDIIPVKPLDYGTTYTATVTWEGNSNQGTQSFSFTTEAAPSEAVGVAHSKRLTSLRVSHLARHGHQLALSLAASHVLYGRRLKLRINYLRPTRCTYAHNHVRSCASVRSVGHEMRFLTLKRHIALNVKAGMETEISFRVLGFTANGIEYASTSAVRRISA